MVSDREHSFFSFPPDQACVAFFLRTLQKRYSFLRVTELGRSVLNRPIYALQIGESRDRVLFCGAFHGMEWLTCSLLLRFAEQLCRALDLGEPLAEIDIRRALLGRGLVLIPCVNPDGVEICLHGAAAALTLKEQVLLLSRGDTEHWQANANGVDLNHNFNAGWPLLRQWETESGIVGPAPTRYGGPAPESEPETQLLTMLCRTVSFRHVLAFHSQGEEIYWKYGPHTPQKSLLMTRIFQATSGYSAAEAEGLAAHGGFKDWFIQEFHRPGFTVEIGKGVNPLPISALEPIYTRLEEMMTLAAIM